MEFEENIQGAQDQGAQDRRRTDSVSAAGEPVSTELDRFLRDLAIDASMRVVRTLKESPHETTEIVELVGAQGTAVGPFVRKRIAAAAGFGTAYLDLAAAYRSGRRLRYVPRVYAAFRQDDKLTVVMEYVEGSTLAELVRAASESADAARDRLRLVANLFPQLCEAASELHEGFPEPIIHRDIKPENIVVTPAGDPVLIDFGIARTYKARATADTVHFGTADYAPPEQYGFGQTDVRSDVYALGLVLFFCLAGRVPGPADRELAYTDPNVPEALRRVVVRAAAFDPADRFESARDLRRAFEQALAESQAVLRSDPDKGGAEPVDAEASPTSLRDARPSKDARRSRSARLESGQSAGEKIASETGLPWGIAATGRGASRRALQELGERVHDAAERVPAWIGRVWNVLWSLSCGLLLVSCVVAVMSPNEADAGYPRWFLVLEYVVYLWPVFAGAWYAALDKRRIRRWFPNVALPGGLRAIGWTVLYATVGIVVITAVYNFVVLP